MFSNQTYEVIKQRILDKKRDTYLEKNGIVTIRFSTLDLNIKLLHVLIKEKNKNFHTKTLKRQTHCLTARL